MKLQPKDFSALSVTALRPIKAQREEWEMEWQIIPIQEGFHRGNFAAYGASAFASAGCHECGVNTAIF